MQQDGRDLSPLLNRLVGSRTLGCLECAFDRVDSLSVAGTLSMCDTFQDLDSLLLFRVAVPYNYSVDPLIVLILFQ